MNIGIYVYELAEELDWPGPWEVLAAWSDRADDLHERARCGSPVHPVRPRTAGLMDFARVDKWG